MSFKKFIGDTAPGAVNSIIGAGMGMALAGWQDRRQLRQQDKLNKQQEEMGIRMGDYNYRQQLKMWEATNYKAQLEQMKKAGLSTGLMYGGGGAGGATTGSANASVNNVSAPSGGGEAQAGMGMMLQMGLMKAQKENIEADTKNKLADANYTAGAKTDNTQIDTISKGIVTELNQLDLEFNNETYNGRKYRIKYETDKALQELQVLRNDATISENTVMDRIALVGAELVGMEIRNELTRAQKDKTYSDIEVNKQQIQNWLVQNAQGWEKLSLEERNVKVNELLGEFNTSLSREALGAVGGIVSTVISRGMTKGTVINKKNITIDRTTSQ